MKKFISEFKEFISKGNVMDLAVGVIIGGAFQAIVNSLVNDIIMPILGAIFGGLDFSLWVLALGKGENASQLTYGSFISAVINFLLMAFVLFSVIKAINKAKNTVKKPAEEAPAAPPPKSAPTASARSTSTPPAARTAPANSNNSLFAFQWDARTIVRCIPFLFTKLKKALLSDAVNQRLLRYSFALMPAIFRKTLAKWAGSA